MISEKTLWKKDFDKNQLILYAWKKLIKKFDLKLIFEEKNLKS